MANKAEEKAQTTRLAERACQVGGAVCAISITCAQAQLPNWTWILFVVTAAFGAAAFCSGGLFLVHDGLRAIPKFGEKRAEIIKRGWWLFGSTLGFAAVALVAFLYFPPATRLFIHAEQRTQRTPAETAPSTTPNQSAANNAKVDDASARAQPNHPPEGAGAPPTTSPTAGASAAATTTTTTPLPRPQEAPIVQESETVSLYGNTPRSLCGQPRLSARPSSVARPSPTGWILYSTDHLSGFQEQPLAYGEPMRFGSCTLILERIDPELPRFDFRIINKE